MKKLIFLIVVSFVFNGSSCENDCFDCLQAYMVASPKGESTQFAVADFPFHTVVNVENNQEIWQLREIEGVDSIHYQSLDYPILYLNPEEEISSFDFRDRNGESIGVISFDIDFELLYDDECRDYRLRIEGEPIIEVDFENVEIRKDTLTNYDYQLCLPVLEILL